MSISGPLYFPGNKALIVGGKFCVNAQSCCCGGEPPCDPVCYTVDGCGYTCESLANIRYTKTIVGAPIGYCDVNCDISATVPIISGGPGGVTWSGTSGGISGTASIASNLGGDPIWSISAAGCPPRNGSPCFECDQIVDPVVTVSPAAGGYCNGAVITAVSTLDECGIVITEVWYVTVVNNNPC